MERDHKKDNSGRVRKIGSSEPERYIADVFEKEHTSATLHKKFLTSSLKTNLSYILRTRF